MAFNLVEAFTAGTDDDSGFCQPCKFGHLVKDHAVYCHNDAWADSPRKCWRSWYTGGETKDEDCPGFQPNPAFTGELHPSPVQPPLCSRCGGNKIIPADRNTTETCPRCMGDGSEPVAIPLSEYQQNVLGRGISHGARNSYHPYVAIAANRQEAKDIDALAEHDLVVIHSVTWATRRVEVILLTLTAKGDATIRARWDADTEKGTP